MILLLAGAYAQHALFEPVVTDLGGGAVVNWTHARLEVSAASSRSGSEGTEAVEELARRAVDFRITSAALEVPIAPGQHLGDLRSQREIWPGLEPRIGRWVETVNRYYASGRVGVVGALSLVELMKPVTMATAAAAQSSPTEHTGAVLDARGRAVTPCFAPSVRGPGGEIYAGRMWLDAAVERAPVAWVTDAADPVAARAGTNPVLAHVVAAEGCALTVEADAARLLSVLEGAGKLGEGTLVVVVDP